MKKLRWLALLLASLSMVSACADEAPTTTAIVLSLHTDLGPELRGVWIRVYPAGADLSRDLDRPTDEYVMTGPSDLTRPFMITKSGADELLVLVRGFGASGRDDTLVEHAVRGRFANGKVMAMPVFLAKYCERRACGAGLTCYGEAHADICEGQCGPTYMHDGMFEVEREGDERVVPWGRSSCDAGTGLGPDDGGSDHDARLDGEVGPDGKVADSREGADAGSDACEPVVPGTTCNLFPQCGCGPGTSCTAVDVSDAESPLLSCERHPAVLPGTCDYDTDCPDAYACLTGRTCYPLCASNADCGTNGACLPVGNENKKPIRSMNACFIRCADADDCTSGCCTDGLCAPPEFCAQCTIEEFTRGCSKHSECCGRNGLSGRCVAFDDEDGAKQTACFSECATPSDCGSGSCCLQNLCYSRSTIDMLSEDVDADAICAP